MGTYALLTTLWRHWKRPVHPVYQVETRYGPPWQPFHLERHSGWLLRLVLWVVGLTAAATVARILTDQSLFWALSNGLLQLECLSGGALLLLALLVLTLLWPIAIAVGASSAIVRDREHRTWSALLTTPIDWNDLVMVKLASALRWFDRPFQILFWVQSVLAMITLIVVAEQLDRLSQSGSPLLAVVVTAIAGGQFAIGRVQDYATACLIGLVASLESETRQTASVIALMGGMGMVIVRLLFTGALLLAIPIPSPQAGILLLATGPTTAIALVFPLPVILAVLIGVPLVREWLLQQGYRWALMRLGLAAGNG